MKQTIKLLLIYVGYQILFTVSMMVILFTGYFIENGITSGTPNLSSAPPAATGWVLLISAATMIWHLIHFKYISFGLKNLRDLKGSHLFLCILCMCGSMFFCNALSEIFPLPNLLESDFIELSRTFAGVLSIAIIAPICEELLFRGAIMKALMRSGRTPKSAIIISAVIFGVIHINPAQIPFAFLIGLVFGWLYYRTNSLLPVIIGHIVNNSFGVLHMALTGSEKTITEDMVSEPIWVLGTIAFIGFAVLVFTALKLERILPPVPAQSVYNNAD